MSEHNAARIVQDVAKVWLALLGLLALTVGTALLPLGIWNTLLNALIALLKVVLIGLCYMELLRHDALPRLMAVVALFFFWSSCWGRRSASISLAASAPRHGRRLRNGHHCRKAALMPPRHPITVCLRQAKPYAKETNAGPSWQTPCRLAPPCPRSAPAPRAR